MKMTLETITMDKGEKLAKRMRLNGRPIKFIRGEVNDEDETIRIIAESKVFGFRRRAQ